MATAPEKALYLFTVEEYLTFERTTEERHEYLDGLIYAMAGESPNHGHICTNLTISLGTGLRGTPCAIFSKDTKVRSGPDQAQTRQGLWSYPDLVIVCGTPQYHDQYQDVLLNPRVVIEVLSPSTERFDRGEKWERYRTWLPSLEEYLLVAQDRPCVEHWHRHGGATWQADLLEGIEATLVLASIGCQVPFADLYDRVVFPKS